MNPRNFFAELKRRNVYKVAVAYAIVAWLLIQIATQVFPFFEIPNWAVRLVVLLLALGFPVALVLAWAFELTPEGIKRAEDVSPNESITSRTGRKLVGITIALAVIAAGMFCFSLVRPRLMNGSASSPSQTSARTAAPAIPEKSIAVLPFENLSAEKDDAFFADGLQDDVLTTLGKVKELTVIARASVMSYRGAAVSGKLREIGKTLGVSYVLEGSVRRSASQVVLNVRLIDTRDEHQIWSERYDRTLTESLGLQGELATEIARALRARLDPGEKARLATRPTNNPEAYVLYLKARDKENTASSAEEGLAADELYGQALALDPTFALAAAHQSMWNSVIYQHMERKPERKAKAHALATEALRLAPDLAEAHLAQGTWLFRTEKDYDAALKEFSIAAQTMGNDPELLGHFAILYRRQGRWREALAKFQRAQEVDPRVTGRSNDLAQTYFSLRDWQAAAAEYRRVLEIEPNNVGTLISLAHVAMFGEGDLGAAKAILQKVPNPMRDTSGRPNEFHTVLRWELCMWERDFAAAEKVLDEFPGEFSGRGEGFKTVCLAWTALARGDTAAARTLLEKVGPIFEAKAQSHPDEPGFHVNLGILYAYLGRKEDALRESRRAVELLPANKDAIEGPAYLWALAWVYAVTGETEEAITLLEHLLTMPVVYLGPIPGVTLADLRLSWKWDGLRENVRFQKILEGPEPKTIY